MAFVKHPEKKTHVWLGSFEQEEDAARNADYYILKFYPKNHHPLNFTDFDYSNFQPKRRI